MSGLEIVGVVLGAVPLIVNAIDNYSDGVRKIRKLRYTLEELDLLRIELEIEHEKFFNSLELLLEDGVDEQTLFMLLRDVGGDLWKDDLIETCLRRKLGRSYATFFRAVEGIKRSTEQLRDSLGAGSEKKNFWSRGFEKLKASLSLKDFAATLSNIERNNRSIDRLVTQTLALKPFRQSRERIADADTSRSQALSVFAALMASQTSSCGIGHQASICVKPQATSLTEANASSEYPGAAMLKLLLHHETPLSTKDSKALSWEFEEADVALLHKGDGKIARAPTFKQRVQVGSRGSRDLVTYQQRIQEVKDLCVSLNRRNPRNSGVCIGILPDHENRRWHGMYWPIEPLIDRSRSRPTTVLAQLLLGKQARSMTDSGKRLLAYSLARGILQLYDTPWLPQQWGHNDVLLVKTSSGFNEADPFLRTGLAPAQSKLAAPGTTYFQTCSLIRNPTIFSLGILLIELCMEQTFAKLSASINTVATGAKHELTDFVTASRLVDEVHDKMGPRYGRAVGRCVGCHVFDVRDTELSNQAFKKAFYDGVVAELQMDVDTIQRSGF